MNQRVIIFSFIQLRKLRYQKLLHHSNMFVEYSIQFFTQIRSDLMLMMNYMFGNNKLFFWIPNNKISIIPLGNFAFTLLFSGQLSRFFTEPFGNIL